MLARSFHGSPDLKLSATLVNGLPVNVLPLGRQFFQYVCCASVSAGIAPRFSRVYVDIEALFMAFLQYVSGKI